MSSRPTTPITASDLNRDLPPLPPRSHSNTSTPLPDQLPRRSSGSSFLPPRLRTSREGSTLSRTSTDVTANSESTYVNANVDDAEWHSEDDTAADTVSLKGKGMETTAKNAKDGRIDVRLKLKCKLSNLPEDYALGVEETDVDHGPDPYNIPSLNIIIFVTGSRGDVQPYLSLAIALILCPSHHRVRIATHPDFKHFVLETGKRVLRRRWREYGDYEKEGGEEKGKWLEGRLEFFDVGGSPKELMAYMVKNPGLIPGIDSIKSGDIGRKQKMVKEMLHNFLGSCYLPDQLTGETFVANAMISNPPSFAHVHIAEALGLPLLLSFTMPWSPTTAFNHPLVNVKQSNAEQGLTNYLTYGLAELMTWQGLGGIINHFRTKTLGLPELHNGVGPGIADRLKIPWMYCWSPTIVPKPKDWKQHIDIVGYFFLQDSEYKPDPKLLEFLEAGPPPIYIGFGSIVVDNPDELTRTIFEAVRATGVRALVSAGWSEVGGSDIPEGVFILGNVPHEWLFAEGRVKAVVHHGGAGTTAIGLKNGIPTVVVPFFGDQPFQGAMVERAGAGPHPIPYKKLNVETLSNAILEALTPEMREHADKLGQDIRNEDGEAAAVLSFHKHLPLLNMRCDLYPSLVATWWSKEFALRLSDLAAQTLINEGKIEAKSLRPHRAKDYYPVAQDAYPLAGGVNAILRTLNDHVVATSQLFYKPAKGLLNLSIAQLQALYVFPVGLHNSLENLPRFWGSEVRSIQPKSITEGFKEGAIGLGYGFASGYGGLVYKPMLGAKTGGTLGALKGLAQSIPDALFQPAAGALGLVVQPGKGMVYAYQKARRKRNHPFPKPLSELGQRAYEASSPDQRQEIVRAFEAATPHAAVEARKCLLTEKLKACLHQAQQSTTEAITENPPPDTPPEYASVERDIEVGQLVIASPNETTDSDCDDSDSSMDEQHASPPVKSARTPRTASYFL